MMIFYITFQAQDQKHHSATAGASAAPSLPSGGINGVNSTAGSAQTHFVSECALGKEDAVRRVLNSQPVDARLLAKGLQVGRLENLWE